MWVKSNSEDSSFEEEEEDNLITEDYAIYEEMRFFKREK